ALLADSIEFVEKQNARRCPDVVEHMFQATSRFPEETADHGFVANSKKWQGERFRDGFRKRGLAISRRTHKQDAMSRLQRMGAEHTCTLLLLNQLPRRSFCNFRQDEVAERSSWCSFRDEVPGPRRCIRVLRNSSQSGTISVKSQRTLKALG